MLFQRPLDPADIGSILDLLDSKPTTLHGFNDPAFHEHFKNNVKQWIPDPLFFAIGIFDDTELQAMVMAREAESSPSWVWVHWLSRPGFTSKILTRAEHHDISMREVMLQADNALFDEMEINRKLNRMFFMTADSSHHGGIRSNPIQSNNRLMAIMTRFNARFSRYQVITECAVEPGTEPKYAYQRALLGNRLWPMKIHIRMGVMINQLDPVV